MVFRFAVGDPHAARSSSWKFWSQGDEAYLLLRGITSGVHKFSFHKPGNCRWARIQAGVPGSERAMLEWQRDAIPARGLGEASLLMAIAFPTNHLSSSISDHKENIILVPPAPANKATLIEIFLTREPKNSIVNDFLHAKTRSLLYYKVMRSGISVCAARSEFDCGPTELKVEKNGESAPLSGVLSFPDVDANKTGRPIRLLLMPRNSLPPTVWELGGYEAGP